MEKLNLNNRALEKLQRLKSYMPDYYDGFLEIEEILKAQSIEIEIYLSHRDSVFNNMFLDTLEEKGVDDNERILKIKGQRNKNLDDRKNGIISKWMGSTKLDETKIKSLSKFYTGEIPNVIFRDGYIRIIYNCVPSGLTEFWHELKVLRPCHLGISFAIVFNVSLGLEEVEISFKEKYLAQVSLGLKSTQIESKERIGCLYIPNGRLNPDRFGMLYFDGNFNLNGEQTFNGGEDMTLNRYIDLSHHVSYKYECNGKTEGGDL